MSGLSGVKVLVTGGAGFLGRHLLPQLLQTGAQVTCVARSRSTQLADVEIIPGDLRDARTCANAAQGHELVIHMAGALFARNWREYLAANSHMAQNMAIAAQNCRRFVFISSLAASGPCGAAPGRNEDDAPAPVSAYGWSKLIAEAILARHLGECLVILRPPIIYGSRDKGLLPLFRAARRGFGISPAAHFPVSVIHAADCARAILLTLSPEANGVYHLNDGASYIMDDICQAMARAQGRARVRILRPPRAVMGASAALAGAVGALWGATCDMLGKKTRAPAWNPDKFRESVQAGWLADANRITNQLGFAPRLDLDTGMAEAVAGYEREGWL